MIQLAWSQVKQARNQQEVFDEVNKLLDRVGDFVKRYEDLGKKIESLQGSYDDTKKKLYTGNQSVVKAAEKLVSLGAKKSRVQNLPQRLTPDDPLCEAQENIQKELPDTQPDDADKE
jgi:DNA recombination protein RmuC